MSYLYHSEVIVESGWDNLGFWRDEKVLNVYVDEYVENPRDEYDHIAQFQQLEKDSREIDDFDQYLREALCAADILTCDSRYGCSHHSWNYRYGSYYLKSVLDKHIKLWYPDIVWHGDCHQNGYSQGHTVHVYGIVTKSDMLKHGFSEKVITPDRAREIAEGEFKEYSAWALGDCYWAEYEDDSMGGFIGSDFDAVLEDIKGNFGIA